MKKRLRKRTAPRTTPVGDAETLTGTVESIVFRSEETGYTVCKLKVQGTADPVTVVGHCPAVWEGETLRAEGPWVRHAQHGLQLQADSMTCVAPTSAKGIERYLASGMVRGIGKVMAKRLVGHFGDDTLKVIDKESKRLEEVEGIGPVRRNMIKESWVEQQAVRDIMIFLQSHGVGTAQSARIYRQYGNHAVAVITQNPYRLSSDVWGIGFKTADSVAMSLGIPRDSELRARAGLVYVLETLTEQGHCFCPRPELILQAQALLDIPAEVLADALNHELERGALVLDKDRVYLASLHEAEERVVTKIAALLRTTTSFRPIAVDKALPWAEQRMRIRFAPMQASAIRMALSKKVSIMTGGPGVGKTTIIRALVDVFKARRLSVMLAAPTGRASKRMEEATRHDARTIHRMLKFLPRQGCFEHGPADPLEGDVFILDEVSMVDLPLMAHFLGALPDSSVLILVGDTDQLPSVGPGNVLRDLIESGVVPCTRLDRIFRQERGGWIVRNAHHVNRGEALELAESDASSDFYFVETLDPDQMIRHMLDLVADRIPARFGFNPRTDIQVLTPMRKNQLGADNLNDVLQEKLNPRGPDVQRFGRRYRVGDRVMQIRNNYDKEVFNGDVGLIADLERDTHRITVDFDGRLVPYDVIELDELVHAYACSIHKAQGSEYPVVIILLATQHFKLLQRNLLYTALTRARKLVCLVGSGKAVRMAIRNNEIRLRRTGLRERLAALQSAGRSEDGSGGGWRVELDPDVEAYRES